jgi:hypothetical protein
MSPAEYVMWISGFMEMKEGPLSEEEVKCIKDHLALVVNKVTPEYTPNKRTNLVRDAYDPYKRIC